MLDLKNPPKFNTLEEAEKYLEQFGKLEFFGWEGMHEYAVYNLNVSSNLKYGINIYSDGRIAYRP